jgi:uncharacterized protein YndB with AHSA1/START domain
VIDISFEATDEPVRLIVTEVMPYPIATVWLAETEGLYVQQWWAPKGYVNTDIELALTEGGPWRVTQRDPQGNHFSFYGRVERVDPLQTLEISLTSELFPEATLQITQEFAARGDETIVVSTYVFPDNAALTTYLALGGTDRLKDASEKLDVLLAQLAN